MAQRMERYTGMFNPGLLAGIRKEAGPCGVSAFLTEAAKAWRRRRILRLIDELNEKYGAPSPELMAEIAADAEQIFGHR
ncbi:MAG: hypothetical protein ACRD0K_10875 [Egibacteraceae bacterium]